MNFLRLFASFFKVSLISETAYRINFFMQVIETLLSLAVSLGGIAVIFSHTDSLAGWGPTEIIVLVGVYFLVGGIISVVIQPGMENFIESVRVGTLDFKIGKPVDTQLLISISHINIWAFIDIVLGLGIIIFALFSLGQKLSILQAWLFCVMLTAGGSIIYGFFLILATLSFWFVRVENILVIFQSMYEAGRWPVSLYPAWLRYGLTFIVPVAFATTIPAEALTNRLAPETALLSVGLAFFMLIASRIVWQIGLKHYSGASA